MTAKQTFADRLRACMERMNYKQRYVADQVGVSQPAVAKWLAGDTRKVQADVLFRLADLFNVNARWLSDGQGQPCGPARAFGVCRGNAPGSRT